jgi:hypothetical protein
MDDFERFTKSLGNRIEQLRVERGWSRLYVSRTYELYDVTMRGIGQGAAMALKTLYRIACMYEMTVAQLLEGVETIDLEKPPVHRKRRAKKKPVTNPIKRTQTAKVS